MKNAIIYLITSWQMQKRRLRGVDLHATHTHKCAECAVIAANARQRGCSPLLLEQTHGHTISLSLNIFNIIYERCDWHSVNIYVLMLLLFVTRAEIAWINKKYTQYSFKVIHIIWLIAVGMPGVIFILSSLITMNTLFFRVQNKQTIILARVFCLQSAGGNQFFCHKADFSHILRECQEKNFSFG